MSPQRKRTIRVTTMNVAEEHVRRFWLMALALGAFLFGYFYYFAEVWPVLLLAGSG